MNYRNSALTICLVVLLAGCVGAISGPAVVPRIEIHPSNPIVVPSEAIGRLTSTNGCVRLELETGHVLAAQFPEGTAYSASAQGIVMPNGQVLPFGKRLDLVVNGGPNLTSLLPECAGIPATQVVRLDD